MGWAAGHYTVFDDEAFSCRRYAMPAGEMVSLLWRGAEPDPPLYYLLENAWVRAFGVGPLGLRSLSIVFFLTGLVMVRIAGQAWFDRRTGLAAMVLCALHPAHLFFGFAARWYSLMFLMTAMILWLTARLSGEACEFRAEAGESESGTRAPSPPDASGDQQNIFSPTSDPAYRHPSLLLFAWSLAAAGACYTNYFGPVVAGLAWLIGLRRSRGRPGAWRSWVWAAAGAIVLCLPWLIPFRNQLSAFPTAGAGSALGYVALLARVLLVLLAGNLASIEAWWVWAPLTVFGIGVAVLIVRCRQAVAPLAIFVAGCLIAGIASRTMIDKYVMTFSGAACLLAAALLVRNVTSPMSPTRVWARAALACLIVGWLGCGVNLVTQRHWSSLRWQDPFAEIVAELAARRDAPPPTHWIMTHPSARYYFGCLAARRAALSSNDAAWKIGARSWRQYAEPPETSLNNAESACGTPTAMLERMLNHHVSSLITVETTGFRALADDWDKLLDELHRSYIVVEKHTYLEDPDATLKDRLDPTVIHPRWRITVRRWEPAQR